MGLISADDGEYCEVARKMPAISLSVLCVSPTPDIPCLADNLQGSTDLFWWMGLAHKKASGKASPAARKPQPYRVVWRGFATQQGVFLCAKTATMNKSVLP
jgi:hypothetical protein